MDSSILTVDETKTLLQIPLNDTSKDTFIELNIPIIEDFIMKYCKDDFVDGFPSGLKAVASQMIYFNLQKPGGLITNEKIGDSYQVQYSTEYPQSILKQLNTYTKIRFI